MVIDTFLALVPAVLGLGAAAAVFYYAFAVIATNLYGDIFVEFETLGSSLLMTLETFGIGGWMTPAAARVMDIFPHAWIFFGIQSVVAFLLVVSFVAAAVAETRLKIWNGKAFKPGFWGDCIGGRTVNASFFCFE